MLLIILLANAVSLAAAHENGYFIYPVEAGTSWDFRRNELWYLGETRKLQWATQFPNYSITLWQKNLEGSKDISGAKIFGMAFALPIQSGANKEMPEVYSESTAVAELNWKVDLAQLDLDQSPVFYLALWPTGNTCFNSHYFNVTATPPQSLVSTGLGTSSISSLLPTSTQSTFIPSTSTQTTSAQSTATQSTPTEITSPQSTPAQSPATSANTSSLRPSNLSSLTGTTSQTDSPSPSPSAAQIITAPPSSSTNPGGLSAGYQVALGLGMAVGILILSAVGLFLFLRLRKKKKARTKTEKLVEERQSLDLAAPIHTSSPAVQTCRKCHCSNSELPPETRQPPELESHRAAAELPLRPG